MASHQTHLATPHEEQDRLIHPTQPTADYSTFNPALYDEVKVKHQEVEKIEADLKSCPYTCYKCWVIFVLICSAIGFVFSIVAIFAGLGMIYVASAAQSAWNIFQLYQERKAMSDLDAERAEKALLCFKYYIVAIPILYLIFGIVQGLTAWGIILSVILNAALFYMLILYPGQKVAEKLRRREDLKRGPVV